MRKILNILAALFVAVVATSCLEHDLEELEVFDGCDITRIDCEFRWKTGEIHPGTGAEKVNQVYLKAARSYETDEADPSKGVCTIKYDNTPIPDEYKATAEQNMVVYVTISTAAIIKPIGDAPTLGIPADWTKDHQYEVTAADGTKKTWTIVVEPNE